MKMSDTPDMDELMEKNGILIDELNADGLLSEEQKITRRLYSELERVLGMAWDQAANGKGNERHASGEPFEKQVICEVARRVGLGYTNGQAVKKIYESERLSRDAAIAELLGAINYLAAAVIVIEEKIAADRLLKGDG